MRIDIRVHTDHITADDLAVFAALAALTPGTPTPTTAPPVKPAAAEPARPAARKAPAAKLSPVPEPDPEPVEAKPAEEPTETKLAAAKRELTEAVTKLARSGPEGRARAKKALIGAGVERVSEVKTLTVAKAVLAALAEGDEADDLA